MGKVKLSILTAMSAIVVGCGGSGVDADTSVFKTVRLDVLGVEPATLKSDALVRLQKQVDVKTRRNDRAFSGDTNDNGLCDNNETNCITCEEANPNDQDYQTKCCIDLEKKELCVGDTVRSDEVRVSFRVTPIVQNNPLYPNPLPVVIRGYSVSYVVVGSTSSACNTFPNFNIDYVPTSITIDPNQSVDITIDIVKESTKQALIANTQYQYVGTDGCKTDILAAPTFSGNCRIIANVRFRAEEVYTGVSKEFSVPVNIDFADFDTDQDECP